MLVDDIEDYFDASSVNPKVFLTVLSLVNSWDFATVEELEL